MPKPHPRIPSSRLASERRDAPKDSLALAARLLARRLDELARVTDDEGGLTRTFLSPAMRRANALVAAWMAEAGLAVREDAAGNLIGRLEASPGGRAGQPGRPRRSGRGPAQAPTFLLGSHLDTVRDAGRFDGALGVLLPLVALGELRRRGVCLPFAVEVLGFSEEEGVRFSSAYLGSRGYAGQLKAADLALEDAAGVTVREALAALRRPPSASRPWGKLLGYLEVHIEQGPVLEAEDLAVGVVSAISGQTRCRASFRGRAGHAGTTPMKLRRDALAGAAEFVLAAESDARDHPPLVATVGRLSVAPGAANVIPAAADFSLDVRHPRDADRRRALRRLQAAGARIARRRGLKFSLAITQDNGSVACARGLTRLLERSVRAVQGKSRSLSSGAGHDAVIVSTIAPVAMLFVRCREGLSHHPDEFVQPRDLAAALRVVVDFLSRLASNLAR